MHYKTNCAISYKGERINKGVNIELSEEEAARLGDDVSPVDFAAPEATEEEVVESPLEGLSHEELKAKAKGLDLKITGSKADLIERITLHQAETPEATEEEAE